MPSKIRILPERIASMIAAGEVVSRPASVVKELVENALDAGAADIRVEVTHGGKRSIRVIDDGEGMNRDDALLSIEQHATSKLSGEEDLLNIDTLGFRGEALAAIASVSKMRILTRPADRELGTRIACDGGRLVKVEEAGCPAGTEIAVESLFFNTPARRKFLRSPETELGHVVDVVSQLAATHPAVRFDLTSGKQTLLRFPAAQSVLERIRSLLGAETTAKLVEVEGEAGLLRLTGYVARPPESRSSMKYVFTYINRRHVKDRLINHAVLEAFRGRLLKGRFPVAVLFLELPPHRVDFNVHPQKAEVRFRDSGAVHDGIRRVLEDALGRRPEAAGDADFDYQTRAREAAELYAERQLAMPTGPAPRSYGVPYSAPTGGSPADLPFSPDPTIAPERSLPGLGRLRYVGQIDRTYLVCQADPGMVLIDQHAAHERILFERFRRQWTAGTIASQTLLFPLTIELSHGEATALATRLDELARVGIGIDPFGQQTFVVRGLPARLGEGEARELIRGIVDDLTSVEKTGRIDDWIDSVMSLVACKAAVKANQRLTTEEVDEILTGLADADLPEHCPHGRPSWRLLTPADLEKLFLRR